MSFRSLLLLGVLLWGWASEVSAATCERQKFVPRSMPERFVFRDGQGVAVRLAGVGLSDRKIRQRLPRLAADADHTLRTLMRDAPWSLVPIADRPFRHGTCLVHAQSASGKWIQEVMVKAGLAYVVMPPSDIYTASLLKQERLARRRAKGLWAARNIVVRDARSIRNRANLNSFQIVEGIIRYRRDAGRVKHVCLSPDPWQSVCLLVLDSVHETLKEKGIDILRLPADQPVRARGNLFFRDGLKIFIADASSLQLVTVTR